MLQLTEWRTSAPLALEHNERRALESHFQAKIQCTADPAFVRVTPGNVVGSVNIGGRTVTVRPKIPIDRILFMTAFAADPYRWDEEDTRIGETKDLVAGMTLLFTRFCRKTLSKGLLRSYRDEQGSLPFVKGRVEWPRQIRRGLITPIPVAVAYRTHDDNIVENQIVRAALSILRNQPHDSSGIDDAAVQLNKMWHRFRDFDVLSDPVLSLEGLAWNRQNEHYRPLLELCRVILENSMAEVRSGSVPTTGFILKMPNLFERFVRRGLEHYSGTTLTTPSNGELTLDYGDRIDLQPDLAARADGLWTFVGDIKYKRDAGQGKNADLYQLLAYTTAARLSEGTLIYAEGPTGATEHSVRHAGVLVHVRRLDLAEPPREVLQQLAKIGAGIRTTHGLS